MSPCEYLLAPENPLPTTHGSGTDGWETWSITDGWIDGGAS